jgi:hypothetical protein
MAAIPETVRPVRLSFAARLAALNPLTEREWLIAVFAFGFGVVTMIVSMGDQYYVGIESQSVRPSLNGSSTPRDPRSGTGKGGRQWQTSIKSKGHAV